VCYDNLNVIDRKSELYFIKMVKSAGSANMKLGNISIEKGMAYAKTILKNVCIRIMCSNTKMLVSKSLVDDSPPLSWPSMGAKIHYVLL
jgi:hypothetical protein